MILRDDHAEVFYVASFKLAFFWLEEESVLSKDFQYFADDLTMLFKRLGEDENVV